jgi:hypothetical protein
MTRRTASALLLAWLAGVATLLAAGEIRVTPLVTDGRVLASFLAPTAFDADAREMLQSGLPLTFEYTVELRRPSSLWWDTTLAAVVVAASGKYDALTGAYQVSKLRDERVVWSESTREMTDVQTWMTQFDKVLLEPSEALEANGEYYVRVRLHQRPRRRFLFWPWGRDDGAGRAGFTFIR